MKKKLTLLLLSLTLCCCMALAMAEATPWQVGDQVCGFTVTEVGTFPMIGADTVLLRHEKTGAQVLLLCNEDPNRLFDLTFVTPAETDMGTSHVFEHATLNGSAKYPSKSLFMRLLSQTYNTFMNAFTYNIMTTYPVSSLSEAQLLKYADFYLDSCFHPLLLEDETIFQQECWRYSLESADAPLTITGTVYSEMTSSYTQSEAAQQNLYDTLFPGCYAANVFGGKPSDIPSMRYEDLLDYHHRFYHPSNSLAVLYGNIEDPQAFLTLMDEVYNTYERETFVRQDGITSVVAEPTEASFTFPAITGASTKNSSSAGFGIVLGKLPSEDVDALYLMSQLLTSGASPLPSMLDEVLPAASISIGMDTVGDYTVFVATAENVSKGDEAVLRDTVMKALQQIAEEGFQADNVAAVASSIRMELAMGTESSNVGLDIVPNIAYQWASTGDVMGYQHFIDTFDQLQALAADGTYQRLIRTYLLDNPCTATVLTVPAAGEVEAQAKALAAQLAEVKAAMTQEEIDAIVAATAALAAPIDDSSAYIAQLQAVNVESLPEEIRLYDLTLEDVEGVTYGFAEANVDGVGFASISLDAAGLAQEDILWLKLYTDLVGSLDTVRHTADELTVLCPRYLYDGNVRISVMDNPEGQGYHPYLRISWKSVTNELTDGYDLVYELLFETQFTDAKKIRNTISYLRTNLKSTIADECYAVQLYRGLADGVNAMTYYNYITHLPYLEFLYQVDRKLGSAPEEVLAHLTRIQEQMMNGAGALMLYTGNQAGQELNRPLAEAFLARLNFVEVVPQAYDLPVSAQNEGLIVDSPMKYNMVCATLEQMGLDTYPGGLAVVNGLVYDAYLLPLLRDQYGVYDVIHGSSAGDQGMYIISYYDPNVDKTFAVYEELPAFLRTLTIDQDTLDGYILAAYSQYTTTYGELDDGMMALIDKLCGVEQEQKLRIMHEIKTITPEDITSYAELYQAMLDNGRRSTAGSKTAIYTFASLFDSIVTPSK